jgi:hypothetical protein
MSGTTSTQGQGLARLAPLLPLLVLAALGGYVLWSQGFYLVDDSYITFRYALNLAQGHGPVWNPGEPVEGYTNALWMLMLAPFALAGLDLVLPAALLSLAFALGSVELLRRIGRRVWPARPKLALLAPLLLVTNPTFAYWSTMGMEGPAFVFWVLLASELLIRGRERPRRRWLAGAALSAAALTRPEGALVAAVLLPVELFAGRGPFWRRLGPLVGPGAVVAAVVLAQLAFRLWYYGDWLPNTFYAKVVFGWITVERGAAHVGVFLLKGGFVVLPGLALLRRADGQLRAYLGHGYALLAVYGLYLVLVGGDVPFWYRFYLPLLPLPLLGYAALLARLGARLRAPLRVGLALVVAVLPAAIVWPHAEARTIPFMRAGGVKIEHLNRFFFGPQVPEQALVAAFNVGMLGYENSFRILDCWGLNNRHIARRSPLPGRPAWFGHEKRDLIYMLAQRPDYIWIGRRGRPIPLPQYDICWPTWFQPDMTIYRRRVPLSPAEMGAGMPPGMKRAFALPPGCAWPKPPSRPAAAAPR